MLYYVLIKYLSENLQQDKITSFIAGLGSNQNSESEFSSYICFVEPTMTDDNRPCDPKSHEWLISRYCQKSLPKGYVGLSQALDFLRIYLDC